MSDSLPPASGSPQKHVKLHDIPLGFYHEVMQTGHPIRRAWHLQKFTRILESLPSEPDQSILDVGCFAGSFLSLVPRERFARQVGVDILPDQIEYAQKHFGTDFRRFQTIRDVDDLASIEGMFDAATLIEVIEHLTHSELDRMLVGIADKLRPGGRLVMSTPNYASTWPLLEVLLNRFSDVTYEEQHVTLFNYFTFWRKLRRVAPNGAARFRPLWKTTTHFISPFLAAVTGVAASGKLSAMVPHRVWQFPFGHLNVVAMERI